MSWFPTRLTSTPGPRIILAVAAGLLAVACSGAAAEAPGPDALPDDVLTYWINESFSGRAEPASLVVVDGSSWIGPGASSFEFATSSEPFDVRDIVSVCSGGDVLGSCDVTWTDRWIDAIPEIDRGSLSVTTVVRDGKIEAFKEWFYADDLRRAFYAHMDWLEENMPNAYADACGVDPDAATCNQLLVDTVEDWVASR